MNPTTPSPEPADSLARAEVAWKDAPVPDGPSPELVRRTLAALRGADERSRHVSILRRTPMLTLLKFAAAALVAAAAGLWYLAAPPLPRATPASAYAAAVERLQDARTLSYRLEVRLAGQDRPAVSRVSYRDPGLQRTEGEAPQPFVSIFDASRGQILSLDPANKVAILQRWSPTDAQTRRAADWAAEATRHLRELAGKEGQAVGTRKIGDVEAAGFRVREGEMAWTVWVDPARKFPLLVETTLRLADGEATTAMSDFRIDPPLDEALFRLEAPEGYRLTRLDQPIPIREQALIDLLRMYAEASGGRFPVKPDDTAAYQAQFPKEKWTGPDDPRMVRLVQSMAASVVFLRFELKGDFGYAPEGVALGDADRILFWYLPKGKTTYRAIFGDLHVEDVPADRLPKPAPKP